MSFFKMPRQPRSTRQTVGGKSVCATCFARSKHKRWCDDRRRNAARPVPVRNPLEIESARLSGNDSTSIDAHTMLDDKDEPEFEIQHDVFARVEKQWSEKVSKLPKFRSWRPVSTGPSLDRKMWPNWSFKTRNPIIDGLNSSNTSINSMNFQLPSVECHVICPHIFFPNLMTGIAIPCPKCDETNVEMDGWTRGFRICHGMGRISLVKSRRYVHRNCPEAIKCGRTGTYFSAVNEKVIGSYHPLIRSQIPFVIQRRGLYEIDLVNFITEAKLSHLSFKSIKDTLKNVKTSNRLRLTKAYLELLMFKKNRTEATRTAQPNVEVIQVQPNLDQFVDNLSTPSRKVISELFIRNGKRMSSMMEGSMANVKGDILKFDHTFAICKSFRSSNHSFPSNYALMTVMNAEQEVLAWYMTHTKSMEEIKEEFTRLCERIGGKNTVKRIYVDNPKSEGPLLKEIFGDRIQIFRDIFHLMQDFGKLVTVKSTKRNKFMNDLANCFFLLDPDDFARVREELLSQFGHEEVQRIPDSYWRRHSGVRKHILDKEIVVENLTQLERAYEDLSTLELQGLFDRARDDIAVNGIDIPYSEIIIPGETASDDSHFNIGTQDKPNYITVRSTSQLESLHRAIRRCVEGSNLSPEMGQVLLTIFYHRWNHSKAKRIRRDQSPTCYDPVLIHDIACLLDDLEIRQRPGFFDYIRRQMEHEIDSITSYESFGLCRIRHSHSSYEARRILEDEFPLDRLSLSWIQKRIGMELESTHVHTPDEHKYIWRKLVSRMTNLLTLNDSTKSIADLERSIGYGSAFYRKFALDWSLHTFRCFLSGEDIEMRPKDEWHIRIYIRKVMLCSLKKKLFITDDPEADLPAVDLFKAIICRDETRLVAPSPSPTVPVGLSFAYGSVQPIQVPSLAADRINTILTVALPAEAINALEQTSAPLLPTSTCAECHKSKRHHKATACRFKRFTESYRRVYGEISRRGTSNGGGSTYQEYMKLWNLMTYDQKAAYTIYR